MGLKHSSDDQTPPLNFDDFSFDSPALFEQHDAKPPITPDALCPQVFLIPLIGSAPTVRLFQDMLRTGKADPTSSLTSLVSREYTAPTFQPTNFFSLIRLDKYFKLDQIVYTDEIESMVEQLYQGYSDKVDPGTFPDFNFRNVNKSAQFSGRYQRHHVLISRFIYHQVMKKRKILQAGSRTPLKFHHDGHDYVIIQHSTFHSSLLPAPVNLQLFYHPDMLAKLHMTNFILQAFPINLIRSAISFHELPTAPKLTSFVPASVDVYNPQVIPSLNMPFSFFYIDCADDAAIHTVYSFVYAMKLAINSSVHIFNPNQTVFVVARNADKLDREFQLTETMLMELFDEHIPSLTLIFYSDNVSIPLPNLNYAHWRHTDSTSSCFFFPNPTNPQTDVPKTNTTNQLELAPGEQELQRAANEFLKMFNDHLIKAIIPAKLPSENFSAQQMKRQRRGFLDPQTAYFNQMEYIHSFPKPNLSKLSPLLPLFTTQYHDALKRLKLHNLEHHNVQYLPLAMYSFHLGSSSELHSRSNMFRSKPPNVPGFNLANLAKPYNVELEFLVQVNSPQPSTKSDDFRGINDRIINRNGINTEQLNESENHVKIFAPAEQQLKAVQHDAPSCFELITANSRPHSYNFAYHGDDPSYLREPYIAKINYFSSPKAQNNATEIRIISPDFKHKTCSSRVDPLCETTSTDESTVCSTLPIEQILAIEDIIDSAPPSSPPRYLVHLTNHIRLEFEDWYHTIQTHPNLFPAICLLSCYSPSSPVVTKYASTKQYSPIRTMLNSTSIHIPLIIVTLLPYEFNITTAPFPRYHSYSEPQYTSDLTEAELAYFQQQFVLHLKKKGSDSDSDSQQPAATPADVEFHLRIIKQRLEHLARFLVSRDPSTAQASKFDAFNQRTVYHFVANGVSGYLEALPLINQCALAHYFSLAASSRE